MKIGKFQILKGLSSGAPILLTKNKDFSTEIYKANIPFKPGVYVVYSVNAKREDEELIDPSWKKKI